jgi:Flp pilus assembly protein TadG
MSRLAEGESGNAAVEFLFLSLMLMVPVVYFIVTIGQIQAGTFAVVGAADQAAKVYVSEPEPAEALASAEEAVSVALGDYGYSTEAAAVDVACEPTDCSSPGTAVTVTVHLTVKLPMVPFGEVLKLDAARLDASATQEVGRFR